MNAAPVKLPHKIATLLYCFNERDEILLMERLREPNLGLWSPPGGKLDTDSGESPHQCACREASEELRLLISPGDLHLLGIVSEEGYLGQAHWLMFLFEIRTRLARLPEAHAEGRFFFFSRSQLSGLKMPRTDVEQIWPLVWKHRGGFFAARCVSASGGRDQWVLEESRLPKTLLPNA